MSLFLKKVTFSQKSYFFAKKLLFHKKVTFRPPSLNTSITKGILGVLRLWNTKITQKRLFREKVVFLWKISFLRKSPKKVTFPQTGTFSQKSNFFTQKFSGRPAGRQRWVGHWDLHFEKVPETLPPPAFLSVKKSHFRDFSVLEPQNTSYSIGPSGVQRRGVKKWYFCEKVTFFTKIPLFSQKYHFFTPRRWTPLGPMEYDVFLRL